MVGWLGAVVCVRGRTSDQYSPPSHHAVRSPLCHRRFLGVILVSLHVYTVYGAYTFFKTFN